MNNSTPKPNDTGTTKTELTALHAGQAALAAGKRTAAIRELEYAAGLGNGHAHYMLGICQRTKTKREYHLRRAALEFDHADAKAELGVLEANAGRFAEATRLAHEAMLAGSSSGITLMAEMFIRGDAVSPDKEEIAAHAGSLAVNGTVTAHTLAARVLLTGKTTAREGFLALGHISYAATCHGEPSAMLLLGQLQYHGLVLDKDEDRGIEMMFRAAAKNHLPAVKYLLAMAVSGAKHEQLAANRENLIRHGAALGDKEATAMLAVLETEAKPEPTPAVAAV